MCSFPHVSRAYRRSSNGSYTAACRCFTPAPPDTAIASYEQDELWMNALVIGLRLFLGLASCRQSCQVDDAYDALGFQDKRYAASWFRQFGCFIDCIDDTVGD